MHRTYIISKYFKFVSLHINKNSQDKGICCLLIRVKLSQSKICPSCMRHSYLIYYVPSKCCQVNSNRWELWPAQDIGFTGDKYIMEKGLLHATHRLVLIYVSFKYYQNIENNLEVMECTTIRLRSSFRGDN